MSCHEGLECGEYEKESNKIIMDIRPTQRQRYKNKEKNEQKFQVVNIIMQNPL
jgi:hypothetical protein